MKKVTKALIATAAVAAVVGVAGVSFAKWTTTSEATATATGNTGNTVSTIGDITVAYGTSEAGATNTLTVDKKLVPYDQGLATTVVLADSANTTTSWVFTVVNSESGNESGHVKYSIKLNATINGATFYFKVGATAAPSATTGGTSDTALNDWTTFSTTNVELSGFTSGSQVCVIMAAEGTDAKGASVGLTFTAEAV